MSRNIDIFYVQSEGRGWSQIEHLAALTAELFDANLITMPDPGGLSQIQRASSLLPRIRGRGRRMIMIAASPSLLGYLARLQHWLPGYESVDAWVIDSFWQDKIARFATIGRHIDRYWISDKELLEFYRERTGSPVGWTPVGADVLRNGSANPDRPVDLRILGRQPHAWTASDELIARLKAAGITALGSTAFDDGDYRSDLRIFTQAMAQAKFTLAFTNLIEPPEHTHTSVEYVTARWAESLSCGASVAGITPDTATSRELFWPGAVLPFPSADLDDGIEVLREAVANWSPDLARHNHQMAAKNLDWRWRLSDIADAIGVRPARLDDELDQLTNLAN